MVSFLATIGIVVLSTGDLCDLPISRGPDEPLFCAIDGDQNVQTPYFSFQVTAGLLVGVHDVGRRATVEVSLWPMEQSIRMQIWSVPPRQQQQQTEKWVKACPKVTSDARYRATCERAVSSGHIRTMMLRNGGNLVLITLGYKSPEERVEDFAAIFDSLKAYGT